MLCNIIRPANTVSVCNLFFVVVCLAVFVLACSQNPANNAWSIELREAEHKTAKHPEKKYFASIWPDGLQVSFHATQGHFGSYTFPHDAFPLRGRTFLSCPGSPELLPMRVVRLNGANDYKIEWLAESPVTSDGADKIVRSR